MRRVLGLMLFGLSGGLAACSFEAPSEGAALTTNTCSVDQDCTTDARCASSMCVARSIDDTLRVVLDVTPVQQADGPAPVSITLPSFKVENGMSTRSWPLPEPVRVRGTIRNGDSVVDADVTLTAVQTMLGLPAKTVTATVAGTVAAELPGEDFEVRVADQGDYVLRVQPKDTSLPPVERVETIVRGEPIEVDYADHDVQRTIAFVGELDQRPMVVSAVDPVTGRLLSSTASVIGTEATLRFAVEPEAFRLIVRPEGAYDLEGSSNDQTCDHDTPVVPTFSIDSSELTQNGDKLEIELPAVPERVRYAGVIELCDAAGPGGPSEPASLPVSLRSTSVTLDGASSGGWTAEVATDTQAAKPREERGSTTTTYSYCVDVFPGDYEIVVTPPENKPCEIFAEPVFIQTPDGEQNTNDIKMKDAAQLLGELRNADMMPLAATTVDVQSLGRMVELRDNDPSLTAFNRSRQTTTDATGMFSLAIDRGSYDVTLKPPTGSGYAWYVRRDVTIGKHEEFPNFIDMTPPIAVDCSIGYEDGGSLAGADITAYAIVVDDKQVERAVAVGKAVADDSGRFMLLLPPAVHAGWTSAGIP